MTFTMNTPTVTLYGLMLLLIIGLLVLQWGKNTPGQGAALVLVGIAGLLGGLGYDAGIFQQESFLTKVWSVGWIWPKDELGAITIGIFQDPLGTSISFLAAVMAGLFVASQMKLVGLEKVDRMCAAVGISTCGVILAWNSLTPWLALAGLMLTIIGGFFSVGTRWDFSTEASLAARFIWERSSGLAFAVLGTCVLASSRGALALNDVNIWIPNSDSTVSTWTGFALLAMGLLVQLQPFPMLGWIVSKSDGSLPSRVLLNQIFPAWAAFALIVRLEPQMAHLGLLPVLNWVGLLSCVLTVLTGLFQKDWKASLCTWVASIFSLSCSFVALRGSAAGMALVIGGSLAALAISILADGLARSKSLGEMGSKFGKIQKILVQVGLFTSVGAGTGVIGFVSAMGGLQWIHRATTLPGLGAVYSFVFFLFLLLGWTQVWRIRRLNFQGTLSWPSAVSVFFCIILALGIVWTGSLSGQMISHPLDRVLPSLFEKIFGSGTLEVPSDENLPVAVSIYFGGIVLAFIAAYWMTGREPDRWRRIEAHFPKTIQFIAQGYAIDRLVGHVGRGLTWAGTLTYNAVDVKLWSQFIPDGVGNALKRLSGTMNRLDSSLSFFFANALRKTVEIPGKSLQLVQTGDVRWYVFIALTTGFAFLSYFLKQ